ncbi:Protein spitz [Frankliniella fusca]|uniref:Protein spitz n=1 Tax=Frankliniella fusca TaxID=407009 RepID=A0AAE1H324_9NEOP|nr:Protein spitz [Frankliniella fusca]
MSSALGVLVMAVTMNWFGATGLVTVAKSTLKGAQKAIDKALDIKEDDDNVDRVSTPAQKDDSDSFFSTWGVKTEESPQKSSNPSSQDLGSSGLWGDSPISQQPKRSSVSRLLAGHGEEPDSDLSLGDDRIWEGFSKTQLVVESCLSAKDEKPCDLPAVQSLEDVKWRHKEKQNEKSIRNSHNRLSVVSTESDRRSSDSVEVIGSASCTASPESDLPTSLSASSLASSAGLRPVSASSPDSVEVIPESSESHSLSVEVLGSHSSSTLYSPSLDKIPTNSKDLASPDSVEVVAEEEEDVSLADDSYASASASESTMTQATILEPHGQINSAMESSTNLLEPIDSAGQSDIVASSTSGRTDTSATSLVLDSSTDTIHSDHGSLGRSAMQLTLTTEYPQPSAKSSWANLSLHSSSSHNSSLESIPPKELASPKKTSKLSEASNRTHDMFDTKLSSPEVAPEISGEDALAAMVSTDSSGEGTLIGSSSDDTIPGSDQQTLHSTSGHVRNLLAEAMVDDSTQMRVHSPVSVESRSEGIRLGSEQTSGHTSGDELETTTSSDIEIISSPNGDGSSTTSRQSPAKLLHRAPHGPVDLLKFSGKMKAHIRGLEFGVFLPWLFIFGLLSYSSFCDACSSRSSPRQRISQSTPRPNSTEFDKFHECPPEFNEVFCLNGASCFQIQIYDKSLIYSCSCADGFFGSRCEYKSLEGTYNTFMIETAGIAGGVAIAVFLSFVVCAALYVHMRKRRQRRSAEANNISSGPRPFDRRPKTNCPESIKLTSLA